MKKLGLGLLAAGAVFAVYGYVSGGLVQITFGILSLGAVLLAVGAFFAVCGACLMAFRR